MSIITIQEVNKEFKTKGKGKWSELQVTYTDNGKNFQKKIISFQNPAVFEALQDAKQGDNYDVTVTKDGEYYNWSSAKKVDKDVAANTAPAAPSSGRVLGSNYETAEERALRREFEKIKQLYIVRQSSISNALDYLKATNPDGTFGLADTIDIAQQFVDFVYGVDKIVDESTHE